jgi:hypothetical protein
VNRSKITLVLVAVGTLLAALSFFSGIFGNYLAYLNLPESAKPIFFAEPKPVSVETLKPNVATSTSEVQTPSAVGMAFGKSAPNSEIQKVSESPSVPVYTYSSQEEEVCDIEDGEAISEEEETEDADSVDCDCDGETAVFVDEEPTI